MLYLLLALLSLSFAYQEMRTTSTPAPPSRRPGAPYNHYGRVRQNLRAIQQKRAPIMCGSRQEIDSYPFQMSFFNDFPADFEDALCFAAGQVIAPFFKAPATAPILMELYYVSLPDGTLGTCGPTMLSTTTNAACALLMYTTNSSYDGCDPSSSLLTMQISTEIDNFYTGTDGSPDSDEFDLVTVASHEMLHGLGILTGCSCTSSSCDGANFPSPWDSQIEEVSSSTCDEWRGLEGRFMDNEYYDEYSGQTDIYTASDQPGSTSSHWDDTVHENPIESCTDSYQPKCNSLMEPALYQGEAIHRVGGNTFVALHNMGYPTVTCVEYTNCTSCTSHGCEWCDSVCGFRDMVGVTLGGIEWPACDVADGWLDQESQCADNGATLSTATASASATNAASLSNTALAASISDPDGVDCSLSIPRGSFSSEKEAYDEICAAGALPTMFE